MNGSDSESMRATYAHLTGGVTPEDRAHRNGRSGRVVWLTGLSGAGKTTIAIATERRLFDLGRPVYRLDGDILRAGLCGDLGFSADDRTENIRRAGEVAALFANAGILCLAAFISPFRVDRERLRQQIGPGRFVEVHVATPIEVCRRRDPKGLYRRAERGEIPDFTGISSPYEPPLAPELVLRADRDPVDVCVAELVGYLEKTYSA
jgi:adenylyl-sulfate kinase